MRQLYSLIALEEPGAEPVALPEVKTFLRISHDHEDTVLSGFIRAARMFCENYTDKSFVTRSYRLSFDRLPRGRVIDIPRAPLVDINSVKTYAANGAAEAVAESRYDVDVAAHRLCFKDVIPAAGLRSYNAMEITFTAGYGAAAEDVPEAIRHAVLLKTAALYEQRGDDLPHSGFDMIASLLRPYKRMRIA